MSAKVGLGTEKAALIPKYSRLAVKPYKSLISAVNKGQIILRNDDAYLYRVNIEKALVRRRNTPVGKTLLAT